MEIWFIALILLYVCILIKASLSVNTKGAKLPLGPPKTPIIINIQWLLKKRQDLQPMLKTFHSKYGPIITLPVSFRPTIYIVDRTIAHQALVQNSTTFPDRPKALPVDKVLWSNHLAINISSCLLVFMSFGEKVNDDIVNNIEHVQRELLLTVSIFLIPNLKSLEFCFVNAGRSCSS